MLKHLIKKKIFVNNLNIQQIFNKDHIEDITVRKVIKLTINI